MTDNLTLKRGHDAVSKEALLELYGAVGWTAYTRDPESLQHAISSSSFVTTLWDDTRLIALIRGLTDNVSILYVQDILVAPSHQRQGLGRTLLADCLEHYNHVRSKVLLTDDRPSQLAFYAAMGFKNTKDTALNAFVSMEGL